MTAAEGSIVSCTMLWKLDDALGEKYAQCNSYFLSLCNNPTTYTLAASSYIFCNMT
jgi:hypothetical protein